ncbi:MAG: gliding motility-associated ABC transporter ATP-binding subunit GldA [Bacteroidetes bacterium]|jgi:ABC-2 type transport system ATP-binding protein|nr:gliding motility-associated ABC transporter ATP-binding subunit GldA [Bacteroidota bacterium]
MSIQIDRITKLYGEQKALHNVSFQINNNEIVGFIGPNGAGKSTMMKIICGLLHADSGSVKVDGVEVFENPLLIKKKLGYLPENNPLYPEMYVREYLLFMAGVHQIRHKKEVVNNIIKKTGLQPESHKKIEALSKGYKQRVGLAQALISDPDVLILDEPTSGLDPNQLLEIRNLISEIGKNKTVLLSTHIMQEVEAICERVILINNGEIRADKKTSEIGELITDAIQTIRVEFMHAVNEESLRMISTVRDIKKLSEKEWLIEAEGPDDIRPLIFNLAVESNNSVLSLQKENKKLEEVFQRLTNTP